MEIELKSRKPHLIERRPATMLKDFLRDDLSFSSSSGFRSFSRRSCYSTSVRRLLENDLKGSDQNNSKKLLRSRSKAASTVSALQKASGVVMNVVKHFQFPSVKSSFSNKQGIFARNLSRRLRRSFTKRSPKEKREITVVVKVKDIIRWKSFRDLVEEKQKPVIDFSISPIHPTTTTTTTTAGHSWSDYDFASEYLHSSSGSSEYSGENEVDDRKKDLSEMKKEMISKRRANEVGEDSIEKNEYWYEKDQFSPVSVHDFPFEEDEETPSSFQSSLYKMERTKQKLMRKICRFENLRQLEPVDLEKRIASFELDDSVGCPSDSFSINDIEAVDEEINEDEEDNNEYIRADEKARNLIKLLMQTSSEESCNGTTNELLLDFFRDRLSERNLTKQTPKEGDDEVDNEFLIREAREWMNGHCETLELGLEQSRGVQIIREMERGLRWYKFDAEQAEVEIEVESRVLDSLMNELVLDLLF